MENSRRGESHQSRITGDADREQSGTHAIVDAVIGRYRDAEQHLAAKLVGSLHPDMLVLGDRGFFSFAL
jgi:hypothetical protein